MPVEDTPNPSAPEPNTLPRRGAPVAAVITIVLVALIALPLIGIRSHNGRGAWDQINYHQRVIAQFADQWPSPDLSEYLSATSPGYHLSLTPVHLMTDGAETALRVVALLYSLALAGLLGWWLGRRAGASLGALLSAIVVLCPYVVDSSAWLLPDNAGWLGVLGVMLIALHRSTSTRALIAAGAVLLALVAIRQIHLWAAALVWTAAWFGPPRADGSASLGLVDLLTDHTARRLKRLAIAVACTLPAFGLAYLFYTWWGGLTPPAFQGSYQSSLSWAAPAFVLALLGVYTVPLAAFLGPELQRARRSRRALAFVGGGAALGLFSALATATDFDQRAGRWSGLWNVVRSTPTLSGDRSILIAALATLGGASLVLWLRALPSRSAWVIAAALAAFTAAQTASTQLWQRYNEPFILITLSVCCALIVQRERRSRGETQAPWPVLRFAGPLALALALGALSVHTVITAPVAPLVEIDPRTGQPAEDTDPRTRSPETDGRM